MLTPRYFTQTILAGALGPPIAALGRYITILSISASTITLSIDDDPPQQMISGLQIDTEGRPYTRLRFANTGGVAATIVLMLSETIVVDTRQNPLVGAMAANLASIDQEISGAAAAAVAGQLADTVCAVTPGPGTAIFAANANRTEIEITAPTTNGAGLIYLGITAARATAVDKFIVLSAGESWWSDREKGAIFACSSTGAEIVNGREC
ncbi:MAG: hypothetical protein MUC88_20490 [Planctomycetes bacterium]|jgi:hypothetical protein|nr:hypothetical protein [Planctomycetota bacterium]